MSNEHGHCRWPLQSSRTGVSMSVYGLNNLLALPLVGKLVNNECRIVPWYNVMQCSCTANRYHGTYWCSQHHWWMNWSLSQYPSSISYHWEFISVNGLDSSSIKTPRTSQARVLALWLHSVTQFNLTNIPDWPWSVRLSNITKYWLDTGQSGWDIS